MANQTSVMTVNVILFLIADSWPQMLDDSRAKSDWGWIPKYDLNKMTQVMIEKIAQQSTS